MRNRGCKKERKFKWKQPNRITHTCSASTLNTTQMIICRKQKLARKLTAAADRLQVSEDCTFRWCINCKIHCYLICENQKFLDIASGVFKGGKLRCLLPFDPTKNFFFRRLHIKRCVFAIFPSKNCKIQQCLMIFFIPIQYAIKITMWDRIWYDAPTSPNAFENQLQAV